jgi:hypothetical protein
MTKDKLLRAIRAVKWARLCPDLDDPKAIPNHLSGLVTGTDERRGAAWSELRELLVSDWQWSEAGAAAAPLLVEMVGLPGHPSRPWALMLLADLLTSEHTLRATDGVDLAEEANRKLYAEGPAQRILEAVRGAADDLLGGLDDPDARVRSTSAFVLAFLSDLAPRAYEPVARAARDERDPWAQASLFLALAFLARYRRAPLGAAELEGWITVESPVPRAFAWIASLYAEPLPPGPPGFGREMRELTEAELTPARRQLLVDLLRAGDPPLELFPWSRAHIDRILAWEVLRRGDRAKVFVAGALAEVAAEGGPLAARLAKEALRLCFAEGDERSAPWESPAAMGEARRAVVATLSRADYGDLAFTSFGLPAGQWDRRRWLGVDPPTALERPIRGADGREIPLWQRLASLDSPSGEELLAALAADVQGADRVEALALLLGDAYGLCGELEIDNLYESIREVGPAAAGCARRLLPELLANDRANARGTGVGMALAWAVARELPPGATLPPEYDAVLRFVPLPVIRELLPRLTAERREALVLAYVRWCRQPGQSRRIRSVKTVLGVLDASWTSPRRRPCWKRRGPWPTTR